jgi:tRNA dimethylallyltransferase
MLAKQLPVICLMGPTAVGKSQLAIDLSEVLPCDIISVDSVMVYRGMDIGTAKPDIVTRTCVPHQLIDIREPTNPYSAGDFFRDVQQAIQHSLNKQRIPLLVGGSMLYFNTLRKGLADLPLYGNDPAYSTLKAELETTSTEILHRRLREYDPFSAVRIHPHDRQRTQRALLVYYLSNKPLSTLHQSAQRKLSNAIIWIAIYPQSRDQLNQIIATRFKQMLTQGLIEEVEQLYQKNKLTLQLPAGRAIGYRQAQEYLVGSISYDALQTLRLANSQSGN